jgi:alpha-glucosidase
VLLRERYIAATSGTRTFPWRYFVITSDDAGLIENTMTCRLSQDSKLDDVSWILPGQASWEWWNGAVPYGADVDFKAGLNVETYKYFMDFAAKYGIEYIVMDEGWAKDNMDAFTPNPDCDLHEIIAHGKKVGVGVILWLTWRCVEANPGLFAQFEKWGVKGVKIDFMDRSDQWMVNFYERTVREAAKHHIFVDYHGAFKPAGLEYMYPNLLSYEGVVGMEQMGNCKPENSIYLPFIRNAVGAMEYTPGAMFSMQPDNYAARRPNSGSIGTRAYQMALFVVFESGLQMLADNPTLYYNNDECTQFIASVPVLWDDTKVLSAKLGDHVVVAKRSGEQWFIGGMTAERKAPLELDVKLDFLPEGASFTLTSFEDGVNADRQAMHYVKRVQTVRRGDVVKLRMVRNGGYAACISAK